MSIILNREQLLTENAELRSQALDILEAGLEAINTEKILKQKIKLNGEIFSVGGYFLNLKDYQKIIFVGIGKCALDGAKVIENILGDYLTIGAVIDVQPISEFEAAFAHDPASRAKIKYFQGTHPYPSEQNVEATKEILKIVENLTDKDLVITLISGGGSALFDVPDEAETAKLGLPGETSLETVIRITKELTAKGADIYELNAARKKMSQVKGGKFAQICAPAQVVSLLFSDVLGNDISMIASGPTVIGEAVGNTPEATRPTRFATRSGRGYAQHLGSGMNYSQPLTNILIVSNHDALIAMKNKAEELGFKAIIETEKMSGNATLLGEELARREIKPQTCVLSGGETTVKVPENHGEGGRNQEMALSALSLVKPDSVLICCASDGFDNNDHAGALVDTYLLEKSKELNVSPEEYLKNGDSYNFFKKIPGAIYTGRRGSNVSDLCILIYK